MEINLQQLIENKNILLVGNSVEILQYDYGNTIDSYDVIVRFGRGMPTKENEHAIGARTDIWVSGFLRKNCRPNFPEAIPLINRCRIDLDSNTEHHFFNYEYIEMFSDEELKEVFKEFGYKNKDKWSPRPSQGFMALLYFTRKMKVWKSLTIIGFDFFAKKLNFKVGEAKPSSWHMPTNTISKLPHSAKTERNFALDLSRNGVIKWIMLSDLKEEAISVVSTR